MTRTTLQRERARTKALRASAPIFAALGDETRLTIVARLSSGAPQSIAALTDGAGVTRQAVTKHLHVLGDAGLVRSVRQGREHLWALEPDTVAAARRHLENISAQWDQALGRLKALVEH
jgi:DNA-binding transcriptional ArsR family regulator